MSSWKDYGYKDTYAFYKQMHDIMKSEYLENQALEQEITDAEFLEAFLYNIKNVGLGLENPHPAVAQMNLNYLELAEQATIMMKNGRSANKLFNRAHNRNQKLVDGADDIFEQELDAVIRAVEKMVVVDDFDSSKFTSSTLVGGDFANIADSFKKVIMQEMQKQIVADVNKTKSKDYTGPVARSGKIDIQGGFVNIDIEADVKPEFRRFASIIKDATISAKNYSSEYYNKSEKQSISKDMVALHLGSTDVFKAFSGALSSLGYNIPVIMKAFFAGYNLHKKNSCSGIDEHIYHMRFLYELKGSGLYDKDGNNLKEVKYLIWNDPASDIIKVYSTSLLIKNMLEGGAPDSDNPFRGIYFKIQKSKS